HFDQERIGIRDRVEHPPGGSVGGKTQATIVELFREARKIASAVFERELLLGEPVVAAAHRCGVPFNDEGVLSAPRGRRTERTRNRRDTSQYGFQATQVVP